MTYKIISKNDYRICRNSKKFIYVESIKNTLKHLGHSIKGLKKKRTHPIVRYYIF